VAVVTVSIQAEIMLVKALYGGDAARTAVFLSTTSGLAGATTDTGGAPFRLVRAALVRESV
jgi:hypothetical protein